METKTELAALKSRLEWARDANGRYLVEGYEVFQLASGAWRVAKPGSDHLHHHVKSLTAAFAEIADKRMAYCRVCERRDVSFHHATPLGHPCAGSIDDR